MNFQESSYLKHAQERNNNFDREKLISWTNTNSIDYWRHKRMYECLDPIIQTQEGCSWLTIGDGRYGTDAHYLLGKGVESVLATDISDTYLKIAQQDGFITNYQVENAEALSFLDNSFDFVLCKEAYHHFPRPMVALYEMIRVAKKGVILIEPQDSNIIVPSKFRVYSGLHWLLRSIKNYVKGIVGKDLYYNYGNYEEVGNYVYTISEREIEKVALGLNLRNVSFKGMNDHYIEGIEFESATFESANFRGVTKEIDRLDRKVRNGEINDGLLLAVISKTYLGDTCLEKLIQAGFRNYDLPRNPYAT